MFNIVTQITASGQKKQNLKIPLDRFLENGGTRGILKMKITHEELEEIRRMDLASYLDKDGVPLKKLSDGSFKGHCPFHEDKNPSFNVNLKGPRWLWHCFGCEKGGDIVKYVMEKEGVTFPEAVRILLKGRKGAGTSRIAAPAEENQRAPNDDLLGTLKAVADYYHENLKQSIRAQEYLEKRALFDPQLLKDYRIGFSDGSLPRDPEFLETMKRIGILNERGGEHFLNCIVFPIESLEGNIVSLYGRNISSPQHLFLKGPHKGVFNQRTVKGAKRILEVDPIV